MVVHGSPNFFIFIHKNLKSTRAWHIILKSNSTSFWFKKKILGLNNKIFTKILFLYEVSIEVLIDFIVINTPNSRNLFNVNC